VTLAILKSNRNVFDGFSIDPEDLPETEADFSLMLEDSLSSWQEAGGKLVWLEIPAIKSKLIPTAIQAGFMFHHTEGDSLVLTLRLQPDAFVPKFATHYIGAGGVVLNEKRELLVICERAHSRHRPHYYKLPGGALLPREHLVDGVIREVYEETGIHTRFISLMCFRHWHGYRYGKSDIYFICRLHPLTYEITMQESEIEQCLWMPVDEYLNLDSVGIFNKRVVQCALKEGGLQPTWMEGYGDDRSVREIFIPWQAVEDANK
jgi:8-oxo-dGTP pyrophosphatase MutT (NUDIX family)